MKLEESEVAGTIREAVGEVERHLGVGQGGSESRRGMRQLGVKEGNPGDSRGGIAASGGRGEGERG